MPHKSEGESGLICEENGPDKLSNNLHDQSGEQIVKTIGSRCDIIVKAKGINSINLNNALNLKNTTGTIIPLTNKIPYSSEHCSSKNSSSTNSNSGSCEDLTARADTIDLEGRFNSKSGCNRSLEVSDDENIFLHGNGCDELLTSNPINITGSSELLEREVQDYDFDEESGCFQKKTISLSPSSTSSNLSLYSSDLICGEYKAEMERPKKIYKVVLTGGPCGGKTTGQHRLATFFENLGWKVLRVPEAANILLGAGIKFSDLSPEQADDFQNGLLNTMIAMESCLFSVAEREKQDVLIICDRGTMDASAFIPRSKWEEILKMNHYNEVELRDTRYHHIIHMVSAANGAEPFYTCTDHATRSEGIELARMLDQKAAQAWVGHPYFDVVDNSTDFETKVCRMIQCVCQKLGIDARDRLQTNARKVKYLLQGPLPDDSFFPPGFQDFVVVHDYLQTNGPKVQARLRKRGQKGHWSFTYTVRRPEVQGQVIEVKTALQRRDYCNMLAQRDHNHLTVFKNRRCFLVNDQYFQLDSYLDPCHERCKGIILLETYSTLSGEELKQRLPNFLTIIREVTGDPRYSMFNLSLKENWENNEHFCKHFANANKDLEDISSTNGSISCIHNQGASKFNGHQSSPGSSKMQGPAETHVANGT